VCDSLLNIGPCGDVSIGEPAFLSEEFSSNTQDPDIELVTTSGYAKNGALCVLQRSLRPQVVTTFELPGCHDMWTVIGSSERDRLEGEFCHAYLILTQRDSTMVRSSGLRESVSSQRNELSFPTLNFCYSFFVIFRSGIF